MLKLKDEFGNVLPGLYKDHNGGIIVEKSAEYDRYLLERKQQETINKLTNEVSELKEIINKILSTSMLNKNSTEGQ